MDEIPDDLIDRSRKQAHASASEVTEHLYQSLLGLSSFQLKDGTTARVESYYKPEIDDDDQLNCGVDVWLDNGMHLEFTLANTGWGKSFVAGLAQNRGKSPRGR